MYFLNGSKTEGEWCNDKEHGISKVIEINGNYYEGSFVGGKKHGHGVYYYVDEKKRYIGEWYQGIAKCGEFISENEEEVLPVLELQNPQAVMDETKTEYNLHHVADAESVNDERSHEEIEDQQVHYEEENTSEDEISDYED